MTNKQIKKLIVLLVVLAFILTIAFIGYTVSKLSEVVHQLYQLQQEKAPDKVLLGHRIITAFNTLTEQTDDTPCEGALPNINFCTTDIPIIATNELPLGLWIEVCGKKYLVADRTNKRYKRRYDVNFQLDKKGALEFGKQNCEVFLLTDYTHFMHKFEFDNKLVEN